MCGKSMKMNRVQVLTKSLLAPNNAQCMISLALTSFAQKSLSQRAKLFYISHNGNHDLIANEVMHCALFEASRLFVNTCT